MMNKNGMHGRLFFLFFVFLLFYSFVLFNLYRVQIRDYAFYTDLAESQYRQTMTITPPRASILDCNGKHIALNKDTVSAFIFPKKAKNIGEVKKFVGDNFPSMADRFNSRLTDNFLYIKRRLSDEEIKAVEQSGLEDIKLLKEPHRCYPVSSLASIVGLTDSENKGILGLEKQFDSFLSGKPATYSLERDARHNHFYFKKEKEDEGGVGESLSLTIDSMLQFLLEEELQETLEKFQAKEGVVIVIDPASGDIKSMVCLPHFDPSDIQSLKIEETKHKAFSERYELGSVIKVFAALAALQEGVVTKDTLVDCQNKKTAFVEGRKVNSVPQDGIIPFWKVIARSNNIGMATVLTKVGEKLYDHYLQCGFVQKTAVPLPGEQEGFINHPHNWSKHSIISLSYGYELAITLLQLARAFCMIAQNGIPVSLNLIKKPENMRLASEAKVPLYSYDVINGIKDILEQTTLKGTTRRAALKGYRVMSKTGTANTLENGRYVNSKNIFTCSGIIQKGPYQRVIVTFIKEAESKGLYASQVAAPLFAQVAQKVVINDKVV